jgi:HAT1-interacting factor 1|tara:strand:- start:6614 stop:7903 length:1290 start_codon:yes stop_codon:yes gene_type:complete|mmetsp:Transcript_8222/g.24183  ORF Transcript_8222/g.24183 Transcript_8222/m.24183 type:complete len:430 (+) Transcript_8222:26-1315(+)
MTSSPPKEEGEDAEKQKQIVAADTAYKAGIAAIRANDLESAIQFLGSSLQIRNDIFGEGSIEAAPTYLKYGCVLFWKAQEDNTVFGVNAPGGAGGDTDGGDANTENATKEEEEKQQNEEDGEDANGEEGEDEEETDMELAWKLLENARLIYLEHFETTKENPDPEPLRKERALELASVYENLGDINQEQSNFEGAIEDETKALEIYEKELSLDDRRIAAVLSNMSLAYQLLDRFKEALRTCQRGIAVLKARLKRLEEDDLKDGGKENTERTEEFETIRAVLGDFTEKEVELKGLADQEQSAKDAIRAAFASIGGVVKPDPNATSSDKNEGIETDGFDKPQLNEQTTVVQVQQVRKKIVPQQQQQPVQLQPKRVVPVQQPVRVQPKPVVAPTTVAVGDEQPQAKKLKPMPPNAAKENEPAPAEGEQCKQQ